MKPWPWYIAGPLIGLFVPALLLVGNKLFGISANLRHACAMALPGRAAFFRDDWRAAGSWNAISGHADLQLPSLVTVIGFLVGGHISTRFTLPWLLGA